MSADLHLHSTFSDGTYTPEEVAAQAQRHRLRAVALTDHDTVEGCARMAAACRAAGIEFIAGSELTAELEGHEIHLIGYYLDTANPNLRAELAKFQKARQNRIHEMVAHLNALSIPLRAETVFALANCQSPGRPHVARTLVQEGFCADLDEAFERFLKKSRPAWVPKFKMSAEQAIDVVHEAEGLAVMAHPGLNRRDDLIPRVVAAGLDGLECFHSKHTASMAEHYLEVARSHQLLVTGGSDCHGLSKGKPLIGTVTLPYPYVERLKEAWTKRAAMVQSGHGSGT